MIETKECEIVVNGRTIKGVFCDVHERRMPMELGTRFLHEYEHVYYLRDNDGDNGPSPATIEHFAEVNFYGMFYTHEHIPELDEKYSYVTLERDALSFVNT